MGAIFSLNLFSRTILWQLYPKTGSSIPQKFLIVKIKARSYYENLKQNIWTEFPPVAIISGQKDSQILFKVLIEL